MSADVDAVRENLLSDSSYHIEFNSYLANHVKHAIVALHGLDAPAETIQRYWDECAFNSCMLARFGMSAQLRVRTARLICSVC